MIKNFIKNVNNIESDILKIMFNGLRFSLVVCIISGIFSLLYIINPISHILYDSGIILFKTGLTFAVTFFICAFAMDKIKKIFWQK